MAALTANPLINPEAFDKITMAGEVNPGLFRLQGAERIYDWDVKDGPGSQGSVVTYRGWKPTDDLVFRFEAWTAAQIDALASYVDRFRYDATKVSPKPVDVYHPILAANEIYSVIIKSIGPLTLEDKQLYSITIKAAEYRPPAKKNATTTPKASAGATGDKAAAKPSVKDAQDVEIERLMALARQPLPD